MARHHSHCRGEPISMPARHVRVGGWILTAAQLGVEESAPARGGSTKKRRHAWGGVPPLWRRIREGSAHWLLMVPAPTACQKACHAQPDQTDGGRLGDRGDAVRAEKLAPEPGQAIYRLTLWIPMTCQSSEQPVGKTPLGSRDQIHSRIECCCPVPDIQHLVSRAMRPLPHILRLNRTTR